MYQRLSGYEAKSNYRLILNETITIVNEQREQSPIPFMKISIVSYLI